MDAASTAAGDIVTATYLNASASATAAATITGTDISSSFSWDSVKEVFLMVLLYCWYFFLFIVCGIVIIGGIYLLFVAVVACFGVTVEHSPKWYQSSKKWFGKFRKSSEETAAPTTEQNNEPQTAGTEAEGEKEIPVKATTGTETV